MIQERSQCLKNICAPTLAGLKTGNLFTCPYTGKKELLESIRQLNLRLSGKGLRLMPLRFSGSKALLYLYRPDMLRRDLAGSDAARILEQNGYDTGCCEHWPG